jgi:RNA polymerase subunit RPABC4/transcription elongation factor Spt4
MRLSFNRERLPTESNGRYRSRRRGRSQAANPEQGLRFKLQMPLKCPVCGSEELTTRYKDGVESYNCENGHVFVIEKDKASSKQAAAKNH